MFSSVHSFDIFPVIIIFTKAFPEELFQFFNLHIAKAFIKEFNFVSSITFIIFTAFDEYFT